MNIYLCSILSKKNLKFLNSYLKSLNRLKVPNNCKLRIIFVIHPKTNIIKNLLKNFLVKIEYLVIKSTKDNIPEMDAFDKDPRVSFAFGVGGDDKKNSSSWILSQWT